MKSVILLSCILFSSLSFATSKDEVKAKTADAFNSAVEYSKEQKEQFQKDMETNLQSLKSEISELKAAAAHKTGQAKVEMNKRLASLESRQEKMKVDLAALKKSTGNAWNEMKSGMSKAWDSLSASYEKAKAEFKEDEK